MAAIAVGNNVNTEEILADEKVVDMDPKMRLLDPDSTQFDTMTRRTPSRSATREKVNWLEEEYLQLVLTSSGTPSDTAASIDFGTGEGALLRPGDVLRNMRTGEAVKVGSVNIDSAEGLVRGLGGAAAAAGLANDKWLLVSPSSPQASTLPDPRYNQRVLGWNYTQIVRTPWMFSGTAAAIELYGGREPAKEAARQAVEHKRSWENIGFFGARDFITSGAEPEGFAGGAIEFIQTNRDDVGGELTSDFLDLWMADVLAKGSANKVIFTGTLGAFYISRFHRSGQGAFWKPSRENVHGVKVDGFLSGVFGYEVPVVVKKEWADRGPYNGLLFALDMQYIERRPLRDRDTKKITYDQKSLGQGKDAEGGEFFTEATYTFAQEKTHGLLTGIAAPTP